MDDLHYLSQLEPGNIPEEVFVEMARLMVVSTVVLFPLLENDEGVHVLLTRRRKDDRFYPGKLHPPGTVLLPTDETISAAIERLVEKELDGLELKNKPEFVDIVFESIERGKELSLLYIVRLDERSDDLELFNVNSLPDDVIHNDVGRIGLVINSKKWK